KDREGVTVAMSDVEGIHQREEIFRPLRVRWPQVFGRLWMNGEPVEGVTYLAEQTTQIDERVLAAFVKLRIATDTPYRSPPGFWAKFLGSNSLRPMITDLEHLQRRFEAMKLVAGDGADESAMILSIVVAAEPGKLSGTS